MNAEDEDNIDVQIVASGALSESKLLYYWDLSSINMIWYCFIVGGPRCLIFHTTKIERGFLIVISSCFSLKA